MTTNTKAEKPLTADEKIDAVIDLLKANGMSLPAHLEPKKKDD